MPARTKLDYDRDIGFEVVTNQSNTGDWHLNYPVEQEQLGEEPQR